MTRRLFGATWLTNATLEEYAVATWLQQNRVSYVFQAPVGNFRNQLWTDFMLLHTSPRICLEVNGDKWHSGVDQQAADRARAIALAQTGLLVVPVWGNAVLEYSGHPIPTDASFDEVMRNAIRGVQTSFP